MKRSTPLDLDPDTSENDYQVMKKQKMVEEKDSKMKLKQKAKEIYNAVIEIANENNLSNGEKAMAVYLSTLVYATLLEHSYPHDAALSFALEIPKIVDPLTITANKLFDNNDFSIQNILKMINYVVTGITQALSVKLVNADFNLKNKLTSQIRQAMVYLSTVFGHDLFLEWLVPSTGLNTENKTRKIVGGEWFGNNPIATMSETLANIGDYIPANATNYTRTPAYRENPFSIIHANESYFPGSYTSSAYTEPIYNYDVLLQNQLPSSSSSPPPLPLIYPKSSVLANLTEQKLPAVLIPTFQELGKESQKILNDPKYADVLDLMDDYTLNRTIILPFNVPLFYYITQKDPSTMIQQIYGKDTSSDGGSLTQYLKDIWLKFRNNTILKRWFGKAKEIEKQNPNLKTLLEILYSDADINVMTRGDLEFAQSLINSTDKKKVRSLIGDPVVLVQNIDNVARQLRARNFNVKNNTQFINPPGDNISEDALKKLESLPTDTTEIPQIVENFDEFKYSLADLLESIDKKLEEYKGYRDKNLTIHSSNKSMDEDIKVLETYKKKVQSYLSHISFMEHDHNVRYGVDRSKPIINFPLDLRRQIRKFYPDFQLMYFNPVTSISDAIKLLNKTLLQYTDNDIGKFVKVDGDYGVVKTEIPYQEILALFSNTSPEEVQQYFNKILDEYKPMEYTQDILEQFPLVNAIYDDQPKTLLTALMDEIKPYFISSRPKPKEFKTWLIVPDDLEWYIKQIKARNPTAAKETILEYLHRKTPFPFKDVISVSKAAKLERELEKKLSPTDQDKLIQNNYITPFQVEEELKKTSTGPINIRTTNSKLLNRIPPIVLELDQFPSRLLGRFTQQMQQNNHWIAALVKQHPSLVSRGQTDDYKLEGYRSLKNPNPQGKTLFTMPEDSNTVEQYINERIEQGKLDRIGVDDPRTFYESITKFLGESRKERERLANAINQFAGKQTDPAEQKKYFQLSRAILNGTRQVFQGASLSLLEQYLIDHPILAKSPIGHKILEMAKNYRSADPNLNFAEKLIANANVWWKTLNPITAAMLMFVWQFSKTLMNALGKVAWNVAGAPTVQTITEKTIKKSSYLASKFEQVYRMKHKDATKEEIKKAFKKWATFGGEQLVQAIPQIANAGMTAASALMDTIGNYPDILRQQYLLNAQMVANAGKIGYHTIKTALHPNVNNIGALTKSLTNGMRFLSTAPKTTLPRINKIPQISIPIRPYQVTKEKKKPPSIPDFPSVTNIRSGPHSRGLPTKLQPIIRRQQAPYSKVPIVTMRPLSRLRVYLKPSTLPLKTKIKKIQTRPLKATRPLLRTKK